MLNLKQAVNATLQSDEDGDHRGLSEKATQYIKDLFKLSEDFQSIHTSTYDAVLATVLPVEIGDRIPAAVFFDKQKRFPDGYGILTSRVKSITKLRTDLYRVETNNTAYLVVM